MPPNSYTYTLGKQADKYIDLPCVSKLYNQTQHIPMFTIYNTRNH